MSAEALPDGVSRYAADEHDLRTYRDAQIQLGQMRTPRLHDSSDPGSRIFFAYFDGTGNDAAAAGKGDTNVELLHRATERAAERDPTVGTSYLRGPGTQENVLAARWDGLRGASYDHRLETMYFDFCKQAGEWLRENPDARISLTSVGFSRGAEQAAGFARMVAERGIQDVSRAEVVRNSEGLIVSARYPAQALRPPGEVAQAQLLFDPVGTGTPHQRDRRPPPQVLAGLQITAEDERRDAFPGSRIIDPGFRHGGRFLNVIVGGCHSDIGGSYVEDGLARRNFNMGVDFINGLVHPPFLAKRHLRQDLDVVHRSVEHASFYDDDVYRRNERRGLPEQDRRGHVEVIGGNLKDRRAESRDAEPIDAVLDARFERRRIEIGPVPPTPIEFRHLPPAQERDDLQPAAPRRGVVRSLIGIVAEAEVRGDRDAGRAALDAYLASPLGEAYLRQVETRAQAAREAQLAADVRSQDERAPRVRAMAV